ncbi:MAG: hypothetical protein ACK58L_12370 [Planctomycetota bacterium]
MQWHVRRLHSTQFASLNGFSAFASEYTVDFPYTQSSFCRPTHEENLRMNFTPTVSVNEIRGTVAFLTQDSFWQRGVAFNLHSTLIVPDCAGLSDT